MKKVLTITFLVIVLTLSASAQEYWNLKTSIHGVLAAPSDTNGMATGIGARFMLGPPGKGDPISYDIGFEIEKWFRTFELYNASMDTLQARGEIPEGKTMAIHKQSGLGFSALFRIKFMNTSSFKPYTGLGGGFYFIQERREGTPTNLDTGFRYVELRDNYVETKADGFIFGGLEGDLFNGFNFYLEGKFSYLTNWDKWDNPHIFSGLLGIRYDF